MQHALRHLVDGAVAAQGYDQLRATLDGFPHNSPRRPGTCGLGHTYVVAVIFQGLSGTFDERVSIPSESARAGIVDEDGILVGCDWLFSGFLVKL
jgi:hypothetical protein